MFRKPMTPRHDLSAIAEAQGFHFESVYGKPYWDEALASRKAVAPTQLAPKAALRRGGWSLRKRR